MPPSLSEASAIPSLKAALASVSIQDGVLASVGVLILYALGTAIYRLYFHPLAKVPGPKLLALTDLPFLWESYISGRFAHHAADLHRQYGPIVRTGPNNIAVDGSIGWPEVYAHRKGKAEYTKVANYFGPGGEKTLIGATTQENHRRQRRHLAHAFSESAMYEQEPLILGYVQLLMEQLTLRAEKKEAVDITKWFNFTTFDIIGDLSFADSFHCLDSNDWHPWVYSIFSGVRGGSAQRFFNALPLLRPFVRALMPALRSDIESDDQNRYFAVEKARARMAQGESPGGRRDFMTYMMRENRAGEKAISDDEIVTNVPILINAGSETTATALSGFAFYLAQYPDVYRRVADEIRGAFAAEEDIDMRGAARLEYLHACIEEALRMFPPAAETPPRVSPGDVVGGHYIPQGTVVSVYQWATFRNPDNFVEADKYRPERWLPESHPCYDRKFEQDNKAVFQPFSHGPRNCIGKNLAYSELRVITARLLYRFDYRIEPGQEDWHNNMSTYVVWEKPPLWATMTRRVVD